MVSLIATEEEYFNLFHYESVNLNYLPTKVLKGVQKHIKLFIFK